MRSSLARTLHTALILLTLSLPVLAREQELLQTSNDKDSVVETFSLETDGSGQLSRLWQRVASKPDRSYTLEQLQGGVVLRKEDGRDAIRFRALQVDPKQGGSFRMEYLYSGIPPEEYKTMDLELRKQEGGWNLFTPRDKRPVKSLHFLTNVTTFLGMKKIIGIRAVQVKR